MLIQAMTRQASIELLIRTAYGRLAYAHEGQPCITPTYCAYDDNYLYSFSTLGQKITWMRENPLVCFEAAELVSPADWATVIVLGRYQELPDTPEYEFDRNRAYDLLKRRPSWWEPGYAKTVIEGKTRPMTPMYFRIQIEQISGHRCMPEEPFVTHERPASWLQKILGRGEHKGVDR